MQSNGEVLSHQLKQGRAAEILDIRSDFPMLSTEMNGRPLIYLDNAATTQKPMQVIDRLERFYRHEYSTVRRGVYGLSQQATNAYEATREACRKFIGAKKRSEIVFTKGTTEAINLAAASYGRTFLKSGDEIIISTIEHHANIVPWQQLCKEQGLQLKVVPVNDAGELLLDEYKKLLSKKTRIVAVGHISNALGTINPIEEMTALAHEHDAVVVIDGAQAAAHTRIDVQCIDCDFYSFSGHKMFGPTGVGVLYGKEKFLEQMPPYQTGGDMIESVSFEETTFAPPPARFEAGTPPIAQVIALREAVDYIEGIGFERIQQHEAKLLAYATEQLRSIPELTILGQAKQKASVISFVLKGVHPHDVGTILDEEGIAVRAGHHCAQPTMKRFGVSATVRASMTIYNSKEDIDALIDGLQRVRKVFHP